MKYPPQGYQPGDYSGAIVNGAAGRAAHAIEVDHYQTYLATRPHCVPAMIAGSYIDGPTYEITIPAPAWRQSLRFMVCASGKGTVAFTSADDTYNCVMTINSQPGTGVVHTIADASLIKSGPAMVVSANGDNRALDITDQSSPHDVLVTVVLTDGGGSGDYVRVYTIQPIYEWHDTATALPA